MKTRFMAAPSANNPVAATAQAFDDDGLAPLIDVNRTRDTACQRSGDCTTGCVSAVGFTQCSAETRTQNRRAERFILELSTGQSLTVGQVRLKSRRWCSIKDWPVVRAAVSAGGDQNQTRKGHRKLCFHDLTFLVQVLRKQIAGLLRSWHDRRFQRIDTS